MGKKRKERKKARKGFWSKSEGYFFDSLSYLKESINYVYFIFSLFIVSGLVGFFFSGSFSFIEGFLRELIQRVEGMGAFDLVAFIFYNNATSALYGLFLGIFLGIFPLVNAITNGIVLGYVMESVWEISGFSDFWRILPHGIFELPAIFIALGLGVKLGFFVFAKNKRAELNKRLFNSLLVFVFIVIPLLVIAAIIEGLFIAFYN